MADLFSVVGRLMAFERGRAVRIATQRQLVLQPRAMVLCTLAMAGEDTSVHAVAIGRVGKRPQIRVVPDPRVRDEHYRLFEWILTFIEPYFQECRERNDFPQIWVSSGAGIAHLDTLADRLRYTQQHAPAKRLGELLSFATERSPVAGQQALVSATGALRLHYATGQQDGEDEHLGALLTWIDPPPRQLVQAAVAMAERQPMGVNTDPDFDASHLVQRLADYNAARRRGASSEELNRRGSLITAQLTPIVEPIYAAVQRAYQMLHAFSSHDAAYLEDLRSEEAAKFAHFMAARDAGFHLPYRDQPKAAAFRIAEREQMIELTESALVRCDRVARAKAFLRGDVLRGTVRTVQRERLPRRTVYHIVFQTNQSVLRVRPGDSLSSLADGRLCFEVTGVRRRGSWTLVGATITAGMRSVGCPEVGVALELGPEEPNWTAPGRERRQMAARLENAPWTHTLNCPDAVPVGGARPRDLVIDVENLT